MWNVAKKLFIIVVVLLASGGVAQGQSTQIRAKIAAVRIVVVDNREHITEIYSNTDEIIEPEVRMQKSDGQKITLSQPVERQYKKLSAAIPKGATGLVYNRHKASSLLEMLYAML